MPVLPGLRGAVMSWATDEDSHETGLVLVAGLVLIVLAFFLGLSAGADARRCATGPSPEEETLRAMHADCQVYGGVWRWQSDPGALEVSARCIGGVR